MTAEQRPPTETLGWRAAGLLIAIAGAGTLGWSAWQGSRPVDGLQRGEAEWLVPAAPAPVAPAARAPERGTPAAPPAAAEQAPVAVSAGPDAGSEAAQPSPPEPGTLRIDINVATAAQLELLPGIGPTLAQRIVDDRAVNGRFTTPEDLQRVRGIGPKTLEAVRELIVCGGG
ncbi:MAG: ComEA family DNA-binding protein [Phycisphaerales bacterium JB039]